MSDPVIDADYNVRNTVPPAEFDRIIAEHRSASSAATMGMIGHTGITYDAASGQKLDVWGTEEGLRPAFVVVHGGYWRMLSRHDASFMARTLDASGIATVAIDYGLAPATPLKEIVRQVRSAVAWVYHHGAQHGLAPERIVVGGSSAGGHLVGVTMVTGWQQELGLPAVVIRGALPISGLFDLRPLVRSIANEWLRLDTEDAAALSAMLLGGQVGLPAIVAVAEHDGAGFVDQSVQFHEQWVTHSPSAGHAQPVGAACGAGSQSL